MLLWRFTCKCLCRHLLISLGLIIGVKLLGHMIVACLIFEILINCFLKWLQYFIFPPGLWQGYCFSMSSTTDLIVCLIYYSHFNGYEMIHHCGFNLHFPNDLCWTFFALINHSYIVFGEVFVCVFCPFFDWVVCFIIEL